MTAPKLTARDVQRALWWHFTPRWAILTEVTARPKYEIPGTGPAFARPVLVSSHRRIDVLLLRTARVTGGIERLAIEVKVTRGDFLADVRNPDKQAPWRDIAHRHAYAVPGGLVAEAEVPANSGLLVVKPAPYGASGFTVRWARQAKKPAGHDPAELPLAIQMDAFWRAGRAEAQIKGYATRVTEADDADALRAEVLRLRKAVELADNRAGREAEQKHRWQRAFGALGQPPCGTCTKPLRLARAGRGSYGISWEHTDGVDGEMCRLLRHAAAVEENNGRPAGHQVDEEYLWVPGPEPADLVEAARP